jgi:hypothetical protein
VIVQGIYPAAISASEGAAKVNDAIAVMLSDRARRVGGARLCESGGVGRIEVGVDPSSRLDVLAYAAGLAGASFRGAMVWDGRGLAKPVEAAARGATAYARMFGPPAARGGVA